MVFTGHGSGPCRHVNASDRKHFENPSERELFYLGDIPVAVFQ